MLLDKLSKFLLKLVWNIGENWTWWEIETRAIGQGRLCDLAPYIDHRRYVSLSLPQDFSDISKDALGSRFSQEHIPVRRGYRLLHWPVCRRSHGRFALAAIDSKNGSSGRFFSGVD